MPINLFKEYKLYENTLIELTIFPLYNLKDDLLNITKLNTTLILDCTGDFYLNNKGDMKVLFINPKYKELLKVIKYIDFSKYKILIINNLQTFLNAEKNFNLKNILIKLWHGIYEHEITTIIINGFEKKENEFKPKYENILNKSISYRILIKPDSMSLEQFESNQNII